MKHTEKRKKKNGQLSNRENKNYRTQIFIIKRSIIFNNSFVQRKIKNFICDINFSVNNYVVFNVKTFFILILSSSVPCQNVNTDRELKLQISFTRKTKKSTYF